MVLYILANPNAGSRSANQIMEQLLPHFSETRIFKTCCKGDEKNQVKSLLQTFRQERDQLVIIGGDGTLSTVLDSLPKTIPFAYLPAGSGNDFARFLQLNTEQTISALKQNKTEEITLLEYEQGIIINSLDAGFAAQVIAYSENSSLKRWLNFLKLGKLTYLVFSIVTLFKNIRFSVQIEQDGRTKHYHNLFFLSVANSAYFGGGILIWPTATPKKSHHDLVTISYGSFLQKILSLLDLVFKRHEESPYLEHSQGMLLRILFEKEQVIQVDGESQILKETSIRSHQRKIYK
ncbi:diacylglycerol/lipid kinase family protein [Streptococcus cameli]